MLLVIRVQLHIGTELPTINKRNDPPTPTRDNDRGSQVLENKVAAKKIGSISTTTDISILGHNKDTIKTIKEPVDAPKSPPNGTHKEHNKDTIRTQKGNPTQKGVTKDTIGTQPERTGTQLGHKLGHQLGHKKNTKQKHNGTHKEHNKDTIRTQLGHTNMNTIH